MSEVKYTVLEIWPNLKEDMTEFLSNPYKWIESKLEQEIVPPKSRGVTNRINLERKNLRNLLDILKTVNAIYSPISFDISLSTLSTSGEREKT